MRPEDTYNPPQRRLSAPQLSWRSIFVICFRLDGLCPDSGASPLPVTMGIVVRMAVLAAGCCCSALVAQSAEEGIQVIVQTARSSGIYSAREPITVHVELRQESTDQVVQLAYSAKAYGTRVVSSGELLLRDHAAEFTTSLDTPGALLFEIHGRTAGGREFTALAGAVIDPGQINPSTPPPEDFDAFWKSKLADSESLPLNPKEESVPLVAESKVNYSKVTLDNINGTHVYGQFARPKAEGKYPAVLVLQWAGVYPLKQDTVISRAKEGWLAMNISAHDLPFDLPEEEFKRLDQTTLKGYTAIGQADRDKSYFLRMFLGCQRALEFITQRNDWNGRVLVVTGTSQGGLQSIVGAALNPNVTAVVVSEPAGCDTNAQSAGRAFGWPYWQARATGPDAEKIMSTSRYFDAVNFARYVKCSVLVGVGLKETTCPATNVLAMANTLAGSVEVMILPNAGHQSTDKARLVRYYARSAEWFAALRETGEPPESATHGMGYSRKAPLDGTRR